MTAPDKAAPIPADVRALAAQYDAKARVSAWSREEAIRNAILADRAARPSAEEEPAPTKAEERIREGEHDCQPDPMARPAAKPTSIEKLTPRQVDLLERAERDGNALRRFGIRQLAGGAIRRCAERLQEAQLLDRSFDITDQGRARLRKGGAHGE